MSPRTLHVRPARPNLIVRDPDTREALPVEGAVVPASTYWRRRLTDCDVVLVERAAESPATAAPKKGRKE